MAVKLDAKAGILGEYAETVYLWFVETGWEIEEVEIHSKRRIYPLDQQFGLRGASHLWENNREL